MSKTLRTAALVVGAVALVATGVGAVAGLGAFGVAAGSAAAAAGATVMSAATAATLATVASVATIASVATGALGLAGSLTAKKPSANVTGSPTQFTADPQGFIPYVMGRTGTAGNIVFRRGYDSADKGENDRQAFVTILSGAGPIKSFQRFEVDRAAVTFGTGGAAAGSYAGYMWQGQQNGGGPANNAPGFGAGGTPPGWTAQHKLTGYAATTWTLRFDTKGKLYANGVPAPLWVVEGVVAYDPRYDSTYPGGNGSHRIGDETTWSYSENPFIHALTWVIGRRQNGIRILGIGAPAAGIDIAAFVEGANVADANGWKVGGVVYSGDGKWDTLKRILQAGMGEPMALGARISCFVNAPKVSLATIGTADVVGDASVTATQPRRDRVNTITPRYRLEANNWQLLPGSPITVPAHVAEDGGQRSREQDYLLIQNTDQVATAVRYDIENAREFGPIVLPLKPVWIGFKPGDCVTANLPELGLNGQPVLLLSRDLDPPTGVPTFTSRSETAGKHPFALGQTTTPPATPGVTGPLVVPVPADNAWSIVGTEIVRGETKVPAIVIAGATDSPVAETVVFEYRVVVAGQGGDAGWQGAGEEPPTVTRKSITTIQPGAQYEAAVSYRRRGIVGDRRVLGPVQVGDLALDFDYVTGPTRPANNADVTSENISKDTMAVGGRDAATLISQIDSLSEGTSADPVPPGIPTNLQLSSAITIDETSGAAVVTITATWTAPGDADVAGYDADIREGASGFISYNTTSKSYSWAVIAGRSYSVRVRAYDRNGNRSGYANIVSIVAARDSLPPAQVSGVEQLAAFKTAFLSWTNPSDSDLDLVEVWEGTGSSSANAVMIAQVAARPNGEGSYTRSGLSTNLTRYYFYRSVDTSGNRSDFLAGGPVTTAGVNAAELIGEINETQIGSDAIRTRHLSTYSILARHMSAGSVTTETMIADTILGDRVKTDTLDANRVKANTVLSSSIVVEGQTLGTVAFRANDPALRINEPSATTRIDPGKILISGGTTLANWRSGADATKIDGGNIDANTITANQVTIGLRGIEIVDLQFSSDGNRVSWSSGYIVWYENNQRQSVQVQAGSFDHPPNGGTTYVWWPKGGSSLLAQNDVQSGASLPYNNPNDVSMAVYRGGSNLNVNRGRTIIDGDNIKTGSIQANRLFVFNLSAITANLGEVTAGVIRDINNNTRFDLGDGRLRFQRAGYRFLLGPGVGPNGNIVQWFGPTSVAEGSETIQNGVWTFATDGKVYYGGAILTTGGGGGRTPVTQAIGIGVSGQVNVAIASSQTVNIEISIYIFAGSQSGSSRGRVEVYYDGSWHTVADTGNASTQPGDPATEIAYGSFTNPTGVSQLYGFRAVVTAPSGASSRGEQTYFTV